MIKIIRKGFVMFGCILLATMLFACGNKVENVVSNATVNVEDEKETDDISSKIGVNMVSSGEFTLGSGGWNTYLEQGGSAVFVLYEEQGRLAIQSTGKVGHSVQLYYDGFELLEGGQYEISFDMSSSIPRNGVLRPQINGSDYHAYYMEDFALTEEMQSYSFTFTMNDPTDPAPRLCFNFGTAEGDEPLQNHVIMIDNVSIKLTDISNIVMPEEEISKPDINLNQIGYLKNDQKIAVCRGDLLGTDFQILDENKNVVYEGELTGEFQNETADEINKYADFSDFKTPGTYTIVSGEAVPSFPFVIGKDIYDNLLVDVVKMLYLQRCGMELTSTYAGEFAHAACHTSEATIFGTEDKKDVTGGWHDAGDYGRYVVPGAVTIADLFLAYEDYPTIFSSAAADAYGIPESGNGIPDILDEARYELEWMLKMQDEKSGGVYHKVTCLKFPGFVMPEEETDELFLSPISTAATGDFAAIMAKSARIYAKIDSDFANQCKEASINAWNYLEVTTLPGGYRNPTEIVTGEYGDAKDTDERYWAAVELLATTKEDKYKTYVETSLETKVQHGFGWADVGTYGNITYLKLPKASISDVYAEKIKNGIINEANKSLTNSLSDGYGISLGEKYMWGSNMAICNNARLMILANSIAPNPQYVDAIANHFNYLLGKNANSYCFVTGYGTLYPKDTHHRPSYVVGEVMPGMLVGGPNNKLEDPYAKRVLTGLPPAKCYVDNEQSYSCNEITIYWNSPFIYLLSEYMSK